MKLLDKSNYTNQFKWIIKLSDLYIWVMLYFWGPGFDLVLTSPRMSTRGWELWFYDALWMSWSLCFGLLFYYFMMHCGYQGLCDLKYGVIVLWCVMDMSYDQYFDWDFQLIVHNWCSHCDLMLFYFDELRVGYLIVLWEAACNGRRGPKWLPG